MNYSHCGSHFGQCSSLLEHTEFDKAAEERLYSGLVLRLVSMHEARDICRFCHLSTRLFRSRCTGSKQHSHVQGVHGEFLQSV